MTDVGSLPIAALAGDSVVRIAADATILEAATTLITADIGILAVGDDEGPIEAVVSERDVLRAVAEGADPRKARVRDVASTTVRWCDASATVASVAEEMMEHYVRHVLIEADGRLVGIVSARDLLGAYASADDIDDEVEE
jgi:CBS domain-containing protein